MTIKKLIELLSPHVHSDGLIEISFYDSGSGDRENRQLAVFSVNFDPDGEVISITLEAS